jgi:hypothetical protein
VVFLSGSCVVTGDEREHCIRCKDFGQEIFSKNGGLHVFVMKSASFILCKV